MNHGIFLLILITLRLKVSNSTPNLFPVRYSLYSMVQTVRILVTGTTLFTKSHNSLKTWSTPSLAKSLPLDTKNYQVIVFCPEFPLVKFVSQRADCHIRILIKVNTNVGDVVHTHTCKQVPYHCH